MKAERRHELKTNALASELAELPEIVRKYGAYAVLVILVVLVGSSLIYYHVAAAGEAEAQSWSELARAVRQNTPADLERLANSQDDAKITALSLAYLGMARLDEALDATSGRPEILDRAHRAFTRVCRDYADHPDALAISRLGLGVVAEMRRDWVEARKQYESFQANAALAETPYASAVRARLAQLKHIEKPIQFPKAKPEKKTAKDAKKKGDE